MIRTALTDYAARLDLLTPDAIDAALAAGLTIGKYADPVEDARVGLTATDACAVAREDVGLLYVTQESTMTTAAETLAARFDHNGMSFRDATGERLTDVVDALPHRDHRFGDALVCEFADGSALAFCGNGWDVVACIDGVWRSVEQDGSVNVNGWVIGVEAE